VSVCVCVIQSTSTLDLTVLNPESELSSVLHSQYKVQNSPSEKSHNHTMICDIRCSGPLISRQVRDKQTEEDGDLQ